MSQSRLSPLEKRRDALLEELRAMPNLTRGGVYEKNRKCGRATCDEELTEVNLELLQERRLAPSRAASKPPGRRRTRDGEHYRRIRALAGHLTAAEWACNLAILHVVSGNGG